MWKLCFSASSQNIAGDKIPRPRRVGEIFSGINYLFSSKVVSVKYIFIPLLSFIAAFCLPIERDSLII